MIFLYILSTHFDNKNNMSWSLAAVSLYSCSVFNWLWRRTTIEWLWRTLALMEGKWRKEDQIAAWLISTPSHLSGRCRANTHTLSAADCTKHIERAFFLFFEIVLDTIVWILRCFPCCRQKTKYRRVLVIFLSILYMIRNKTSNSENDRKITLI